MSYPRVAAPTQSPSYADTAPGNVNLPLSMDPVLAVVTNSSGQQVKYFSVACEKYFHFTPINRQDDIWGMTSRRK